MKFLKNSYFCNPMATYIDIHTHRPTGLGIELRSAGVHPWDADQYAEEELRMALREVQAVGEIGLDRVRGAAWEVQAVVFRAQLRLACELCKPVILHCVRAFEEVMRCLAEYRLPAIIFHGFIGSREQAARALACGYYLSFGARTFSSPKTVEVLRTVPLSQLFLETDDDDCTIAEIYSRVAEVRGVGIEELMEALQRNYEKIFDDGE